MFSKRYYYLLQLQYLGFRYHGWQKQPNVLTVEHMLKRTLSYILGHSDFKVLACGRTDAMVSVNQTYIEIFVDNQPINLDGFMDQLNANLPQDIRALEISEVSEDFQIMEAPRAKEYVYFFSHGSKNHPFAAPFVTGFEDVMDIEIMKEGALLFEGRHDFRSYTYKPTETAQTVGTIQSCEIISNNLLTASFFPDETYMLRVKGKGFKRHQIRLMMGALADLGAGKVDLHFLRETLKTGSTIRLETIAPASGLILNEVFL